MKPSLWRHPVFLRFFAGNTISLIGWGFNFIATGWLVLEETGSKVAVGEIVAVSTLPGLALAFLAGAIIDRMNRKHLLVILDLFRGLSVVAIPLLHLLGAFHLWQLYVMSFLVGTGSAVFWSTAAAFTQELVSERQFMTANSLLSASYQTGALLGSALGGFVVHAWGGHTALALDAASYFISAALIGSARFRPALRQDGHESIPQLLRGGLRFVREKRLVFFYGLTAVLADVAIWGALAVLTLALSTDILRLGARGFGLLDGAYGVGALLSTFFTLRYAHRYSRYRFLAIAYGMAGTMCFLLPDSTRLEFALILYFFMGLPNNSARILVRTILMEHIPNRIMGRAQTILGIVTRLLVIFSTLAAGWITEVWSVATALRATSGLFFASLAGVWITRLLSPSFFQMEPGAAPFPESGAPEYISSHPSD
ncbi:MAG: MFS transporter [Candidatus Neomarinimicrobiota bacterium]|nr:MAG: MFS transporter [Candidatus Neomarinimicrobiota bacterium]